MELTRALSVNNILNSKYKGLPFTGQWYNAIGNPDLGRSWIIYGRSASGKTTFNLMLAKYISQFETVIYNSLEEGPGKSIQLAYQRAGIVDADDILLVKDTMEQFTQRLLRKRSPGIVFIDSTKYTRFTFNDYMDFCELFPEKLKIWVAHAKGKEPKLAIDEDIYYDSHVKIYTEGFRAFINSRFSENTTGTIDIWPEGAAEYWGDFKK